MNIPPSRTARVGVLARRNALGWSAILIFAHGLIRDEQSRIVSIALARWFSGWQGARMHQQTEVTQATIANWFTYHSPKGDQQARYYALREKAKELALMILEACPSGHERDQAWMLLRECVMCANAAIACGEQMSP